MNTNSFKESITFLRCNVCGNIIVKLSDSGLTPQCCGRDMVKLIPGEKEATVETHTPVYKFDGNKIIINVGSTSHPMTGTHRIEWIVLRTNIGFHVRFLSEDDNPDTCFKLCHNEQALTIYSYCNLHGLWTCEVSPR